MRVGLVLGEDLIQTRRLRLTNGHDPTNLNEHSPISPEVPSSVNTDGSGTVTPVPSVLIA